METFWFITLLVGVGILGYSFGNAMGKVWKYHKSRRNS